MNVLTEIEIGLCEAAQRTLVAELKRSLRGYCAHGMWIADLAHATLAPITAVRFAWAIGRFTR